MLEWFKSVWTIQEAILANEITFIGIQQEHIEIDIFTDEEFKDFVKKFDLISDVNSSVWLGGITHLCLNNLNPLEVAELSQKLTERIRPLNVVWYKDISDKHDSFLTKKYTLEMIRSQLGSKSRTCREDWDLIYGIAGILKIDVSEEDYKKNFNFLFYETLLQLIDHQLISLPDRPNQYCSWLPCLDNVPPNRSWSTVRSVCYLSDEAQRYHFLLKKRDHIFARESF